MFSKLSPKQNQIAFNKSGHFVVRACPGSGKTFTVAARMAHRMQQWHLHHQGVAALSFTNVAWEEIKKKLENNFQTPCRYPHFLGTIDSFINQYIFLPFGHLIMNCPSRPVLVGEPYGYWSVQKKHDYDCEPYFDKTSFDMNNDLIQTADPQYFHFSWILKNKDGTENKNIAKIKTIKKYNWQKGFATQDDANYISMKVLERYPNIARAIGDRFPEFIIDEAQDTSEIQMKVIDLLLEKEIKQIMIVGDPDQAIFEWRKANPKLFKDKYEMWKNNSAVLNENWRSSQVICNCSHHLSCLDSPSIAVNDNVRAIAVRPELITYSDNNISDVVSSFAELCRYHHITMSPDKVAVVYRSKSIGAKIEGTQIIDIKEQPWLPGEPVTKDFAEGRYLWDNYKYSEGFRKIERGFIKYTLRQEYCPKDQLRDITERIGFNNWRKGVYRFINQMPKAEGPLSRWIEAVNNQLELRTYFVELTKQLLAIGLKSTRNKFFLEVDENKARVTFNDLFAGEGHKLEELYHVGTVHSVKGETFDAVLLFLKERAGKKSGYKKLIKKDYEKLSEEEQEELRIVYVAITRPRKILVVAVPSDEDKEAWENKLFQSQ
ncbi:MAG: ATP-dependent helicase [Syntrophomonas sp.]